MTVKEYLLQEKKYATCTNGGNTVNKIVLQSSKFKPINKVLYELDSTLRATLPLINKTSNEYKTIKEQLEQTKFLINLWGEEVKSC